MSIVIFNHRIKDFNQFKSVYDADKKRRDEAGMRELALGQLSNDPSMVYIVWEMEDADRIETMVNSPELREKMHEAGVVSEPQWIVLV